MNANDIIVRARYLTKTSATDGTGAETDLLPILNDYYRRQCVDFINANEDLFGVKATTNLNVVSNQEAYALPSDCVRIKRAEITFDGTNWRKLRTNDDGQVQWDALDPTSINNNFSQSDPYMDVFGDAIYLRPIPSTAVTAGLRLFYIARPSLLSTLSSSVLTPEDFHGYLIYGLTAEIAHRKGDLAMAAAMFQKWTYGQEEIRKKYPPRNLDQLVDMVGVPTNYD